MPSGSQSHVQPAEQDAPSKRDVPAGQLPSNQSAQSHASRGAATAGKTPRPKIGAFHIGPILVETPVVLAPMAAITDTTYRRMCRELGAGLGVTEAAYAHRLIDEDPYTWQLAETGTGETKLLKQLYGREPDEMARASALLVEDGAEGIDINCGCPMPKIVKKGIGAALLREPAQIGRIIEAIRAVADVPVTAKIRAGWESSEAATLGKVIEDAGGAAITIHGRTRDDRYGNHADLKAIAQLKQSVSIPVIGNGDVHNAVSAQTMFEVTGCDAVMIGRAAIGNPWIFAEIVAWLHGDTAPAGPSPDERRHTMQRHLRASWERYGDRVTREFRKHLLAYVRGHDAAETLVRSQLRAMTSLESLKQLIDDACEQIA